MSSLLLIHHLLDKFRKNDLSGLANADLRIQLPVHKQFINSFFQKLIVSSDKLKSFNALVFNKLSNNEFVVEIDHKKLRKTITTEIHSIHYNEHSEPVLMLRFVSGLNFFEKMTLSSFLALRKNMNRLKSFFSEENQLTASQPEAIEIFSSGIRINLAEVLKQEDYGFLNNIVLWENISTHNDSLFLNLRIKT